MLFINYRVIIISGISAVQRSSIIRVIHTLFVEQRQFIFLGVTDSL